MQTVSAGYQSIRILLQINWDRLLYVAAVAVGLLGGAAIGSYLG